MTALRRFSVVALAFLLTLVSALPVSAGTIINPPTLNDLVTGTAAVGDVLYSDTTTTWARLADIADGNVLRSGGVGAAPVYGKVRLSGATTDITGTLAYGSGGTGATSYTTNAIIKAGASAFADSSLTDDGSTVTSTVPVLLPAGSAGAPSLAGSAANQDDTGIFWPGSNVFRLVAAGTAVAQVQSTQFQLMSSLALSWSSLNAGDATDLLLYRAAAANLRLGAAAANPPVAQTLSMQNASGTDIAGANFTIDASQGTGTGAGGSFIVRTAAAGGTGSSLNALAAALTIDSTKLATFAGNVASAGQITAGSGTGVTINAAGFLRRHVYSVTVTYAALAAAATTADKTIATLPAKTRLVGIIADTTTPYTGGGVTAATLIAGKTVGGNEYIVSHDVLSAAILVGDADADLGTSINRASAIQGGDLASWTGTTDVSVRLTTVTANTDQLTAGSTTYYLTTESMP